MRKRGGDYEGKLDGGGKAGRRDGDEDMEGGDENKKEKEKGQKEDARAVDERWRLG